MRVLFCKIHCPSFICFCKPTSHIYTPGPLKLENSPHVPSTTTITDDHQLVCGLDNEDANQVKEDSVVDGQKQQEAAGKEEEESENCPRSSLKKEVLDSKQSQKKVQWMDLLGKELVEIREFESSETEDTDNDSEFSKGARAA
ncbi:hypothetical protein LWI28_018533 [Acer negundo]|uniref:Uncharacterized protein n=1 Tax=Acer negundo TaxID=4023 RepID=A0AAD5P283_ACENE|nr:hypothetical protein LWI28_018533 [Acer negundo]KAK4856420.1 hypothetical protein QYF36_017299 [Acer negundo]